MCQCICRVKVANHSLGVPDEMLYELISHLFVDVHSYLALLLENILKAD